MSLRIIVCIKSVLKASHLGGPQRAVGNSELNPFDRPALEAAIRLKDTMNASVIALSMGPEVSAEALDEAQAMGADEAVLVSDRALAGSDTLVTAKVLAKAVQKIGAFDFIFFGTRTADSDTGQVGPQTASLLDLPFLGGVKKMELQHGGWEVHRVVDTWEEAWQVQTPAALAMDPRAFIPRPVGLVGLSQVYDQPKLWQWNVADLGLTAEQVGLTGSPTRVADLKKTTHDRSCRIIEGNPLEQAEALLEMLALAGKIGS
ncbi:MAG: electron transfer flavoprotein subunit beta/FixA family protein [Desulfarculaceae bacterium]|nr:electron transfer flavoprotein subunit beta/FixA family protein [Desulfarculaceae bacterium]MCF8073134.1 electron transfer flavoprotein subunit beta/FixA family protein [Desulfarculaceae bacterium]MCF8101781.1 electron transfer flavoprotein subunit beta/FixA family protein [Desulfarculaceae bacterium]MCF8117345.1 electron transfer flavoprotein subunit beta/FixA family protein [Desulfarculaceae bacterium]